MTPEQLAQLAQLMTENTGKQIDYSSRFYTSSTTTRLSPVQIAQRERAEWNREVDAKKRRRAERRAARWLDGLKEKP
jgi:hypothetical protein